MRNRASGFPLLPFTTSARAGISGYASPAASNKYIVIIIYPALIIIWSPPLFRCPSLPPPSFAGLHEDRSMHLISSPGSLSGLIRQWMASHSCRNAFVRYRGWLPDCLLIPTSATGAWRSQCMQCGTAFIRGYPYRRLSTADYDHGIISIIIVSSPRELPPTVVFSFTSNSTAVVVTPRPIQRTGPIGASTLYGPSPSGKVNSQNAGTSRIDKTVTPSCFDCLFPYYSTK